MWCSAFNGGFEMTIHGRIMPYENEKVKDPILATWPKLTKLSGHPDNSKPKKRL